MILLKTKFKMNPGYYEKEFIASTQVPPFFLKLNLKIQKKIKINLKKCLDLKLIFKNSQKPSKNKVMGDRSSIIKTKII